MQLNESRRRVSVLASQIEGVPQAFRRASSTPEFRAPGQPVDPLFQRMQQLRLRLDELLSVYKEKHPDVTAARTMLESLEAEYEKQQATGEQKAAAEEKSRREFEAKDDASKNIEQSDLIPNPLYQELMLAMGTAQAEMAAMEARVEEYRRRQDELRKLIDTVPKVEAELKRLDRDYSVDRSNYDQLVQRREALKISDDASQSADDVRFNVIEPPREPVVPAGPNRIMFSAVVLVAGIAAGVGFAFLIGLARPAFYGRDDCEQITQLPVLGIVSRVWTRRELFRRRMEVATFAVGCVALLAICIGVLVFHHLYVDVFNDLNISGRLLRLKDRLL
ncbi:MAG: hypothetical protein HOI95_01905 [Chromatiales bacterium]|nr:hypothetical protein [Chromatiales bacterium]